MRGNGYSVMPELLEQATNCWRGMEEFRKERERCKRYTYGDQWGDTVEVDGRRVREEDFLREQGNMPLTNNLIRRLVRNVLGVFRSRWSNPKCSPRDNSEKFHIATMQKLLDYNSDLNMMEEVYSRTMEEFLISGLAVHKKWFGTRGLHSDCWTEIVAAENFFCDFGSNDFRGWDLSLVGEIHEMELDRLLSEFSRDREESERLRKIFPGAETGSGLRDCRIWEIWRKEYRSYYRCHDSKRGLFYLSDKPVKGDGVSQRWESSVVWNCYYLGPNGEVLSHKISPYNHGSHPYVIKAYPFIDGEIHSFVHDVIDQQKFTNRLISMYDWTLRSAAKGVLLFPEGSVPEGSDINDLVEEWSRFNGVITYRHRPGVAIPQQITSPTANSGISELLNIQMKLMEDISGVNGALQGRLDNTSMSGTLYNQQTQNSMTSLTDLLKSFDNFIIEGTRMDVKMIGQFYDSRKIRSIVGDSDEYVENFTPSHNFHSDISDFILSSESKNTKEVS